MRAFFAQPRRRVNPEPTLTRAQVITFFGLLPDLAEQPRQHGLVQLGVIRRFFIDRQLQVTADQAQLTVRIAPLAQAQVVQEILAAPVAQRTGGQRLALLFKPAPHIDQRGKVRVHILPLRVGLIGRLLTLRRTLARVLHRHRTGHDQHFLQAAELGRFKQHAPHARVDRQARQLATQRRQLVFAVDGGQLLQQVEAVRDGFAVWRLDERERRNFPQTQVQHLQDDGRKVGTQNLGVGKFRAPVEVFFGVQPHADTRLNPPAAALALIGAGLGNGFDRQALDLGPVAVAADACGAAVNHITNARHRQGGFCDVGRQDHAASGVRLENPLLLGR